GRVDCLRQRALEGRPALLDLSPLLGRAGEGPTRHVGQPIPVAQGGALGERLAEDAAAVSKESRLLELAYEITNRDRTVGARLGGAIARACHGQAPPGRVRARFTGGAGQ